MRLKHLEGKWRYAQGLLFLCVVGPSVGNNVAPTLKLESCMMLQACMENEPTWLDLNAGGTTDGKREMGAYRRLMHAMICHSAASVRREPIGVPGLFLPRSLYRCIAISQCCCLDAAVSLSHQLSRCLDAQRVLGYVLRCTLLFAHSELTT